MHDFHVANHIQKLVLEHALKNNLKKVTNILVELGSVLEHGDQILADNLIFNIKMLLKNSIAREAEVVVVPTEGDSWVLKEIEGE